ncbi:MAG: bifunctional phosphoribosylaminoimidazolecarboxamide formyltransferase/IMP cyclohydrolase [Anaerolineae bacterium]|nr:bifunctional phosphoribosylaminoimidazolecarboxamide formyltransferase/IMP cyclohydrolase [Anaerolineae bacterium]
MIRRVKALISVSDKSHLIDFAQRLQQHHFEFIASGGTARALQAADIPVITVEQMTGSPEILDGRVKTLHPAVHAGILARDTDQDRVDLGRVGAEMIDLVVANLYPFQKTVAQKYVTLADAIENIDIGGVALIRAAAKNYARVAVICDPADYERVLHDLDTLGHISLELREVLAFKAFAHTAAYDSAIRDYLTGVSATLGKGNGQNRTQTLTLHRVQELRYGENPHQSATLFSFNSNSDGPLGGRFLQGKELSYNNLLDLDAAWRAAKQFEPPTVVIVKHLSPCGIASAVDLATAYRAAFACDTVSAFGGVIATNRTVDVAMVHAMGDIFVECIAAPGFSDEALGLLAKRKNCRLVEMPAKKNGKANAHDEHEYRSITGGMLRQTIDKGDPALTEWKVVSKAQPSTDQLQALKFAWVCVQHVKSNAIVLATGGNVCATVGIGAGQPNRVDSVRIAAGHAGANAKGAVLASDAFFPFPDGVQAGIDAGVTAIVQPGGSVRDAEAIAAADAAGVVMIFTNTRHFRH